MFLFLKLRKYKKQERVALLTNGNSLLFFMKRMGSVQSKTQSSLSNLKESNSFAFPHGYIILEALSYSLVLQLE